jgi:hypothetical protein
MRSPLLLILVVVLFSEFTLAQAQPSASTLRRLTQMSGYVFGGTVTAIDRPSSSGVPTVRITFKVERAVRGVRNGQNITIREWAGLWSASPHYRKGQRVFLFLYPPSKLGLTSPVSGASGQFAVDNTGHVVLDHAQSMQNRKTTSPGKVPRLSLPDFARAIRRAEED